MSNFKSQVTLKEGFTVPIYEQGMPLQEDKWTKSQIEKSKTNTKVLSLLLNIVPNNVLYRIGKYKNAHDLWTQLTKLQKNPSRQEDKLKEDQLNERV